MPGHLFGRGVWRGDVARGAPSRSFPSACFSRVIFLEGTGPALVLAVMRFITGEVGVQYSFPEAFWSSRAARYAQPEGGPDQ